MNKKFTKEDWFALIAGIVVSVFLLWATPAKAESSEVWFYVQPTDDVDYKVIAEPGLVYCNEDIYRYNNIFQDSAPETPEANDYRVTVVTWTIPQGEPNCFAEYEIVGEYLYAARAFDGATCEVEAKRTYCYGVITQNRDMITYGRLPSTHLIPVYYADDNMTWAFWFYSNFIPMIGKLGG